MSSLLDHAAIERKLQILSTVLLALHECHHEGSTKNLDRFVTEFGRPVGVGPEIAREMLTKPLAEIFEVK